MSSIDQQFSEKHRGGELAKEPLACWNGTLMPLSQVRVSVLDRAFLFGEAAYEVIRIYGGRQWLLAEHLDRLDDSLKALGIPWQRERLAERLARTIKAAGVDEATAYIQITAGE